MYGKLEKLQDFGVSPRSIFWESWDIYRDFIRNSSIPIFSLLFHQMSRTMSSPDLQNYGISIQFSIYINLILTSTILW